IYSDYNYLIENLMEENNFKVSSKIRDFNLKQDFQYALNNHGIKFGLNVLHHTIAPGKITSSLTSSINESTIENRNGLEIAAYISDEWKASDAITFAYGLRLSSFSLLGPGTIIDYDENGEEIDSKVYNSGELVKNYINLEPRLSAS